MKRLLLALAPWMVATAAFGQSRTAQVQYTYHPPLRDSVYRVGDECYAPVFAVEQWGWKVRPGLDKAALEAEGESIDVPIRTVANIQAIPLRSVLEKLGADLQWLPDEDTLVARSAIRRLSIKDGKLSFDSTLPLLPTVYALKDPDRLVLDLRGGYLHADATIELPQAGSAKQFTEDTVRVVFETADAEALAKQGPTPARQFSFNLDPLQIAAPAQPPGEEPPIQTEEAPDPASTPIDPIPDIPPPLPVASVFVDLESDRALLIQVRDFGTLVEDPKFRKPDPAILEVVLPGALATLPKDFKLKTDSVVATELVQEQDDTLLRLTLARPMGAQVSADASGVTIQLIKPKVGDGKLAGKLVVVDAGHGGKDSGARSGKTYEKNLNLSVAKLTAQALAEAGATVIMTRKSDVFVELLDRANIANRNEADFFISIHINSNTVSNSRTGSITFHHKGSGDGRLLAECIHSQIAKGSKLPSIGVWSDGKIYQNGFSVLRNTTMPGVLLELGFINHSKDRARLVQPSFHKAIAAAVVKGLKVYLGDG